jgi:hypothetical protein
MTFSKPSARRWERASADRWISWAASEQSDRRELLRALAAAVETVLRWEIRDRRSAAAVIHQLEPTLSRCDELDFNSTAQALAYTIWHLTDRYGRVTAALDALFRQGHFPLRQTRMSILEVGAGPAPAIYAVIDYYSDLAKWCHATDQPYRPLQPTTVATLDRGAAWGHVLHILSEALITPGSTRGSLPFDTTYGDFRDFSVRREHLEGINRAARRLQAEADESDEALERRTALELALQERAYPVGA